MLVTLSAEARKEIARLLQDKPEQVGVRLFVAGFG